MMKQGMTWLLLIAMLLSVMTGCGGQKQPEEETENEEQAEEILLPVEETIQPETPDVETEPPTLSQEPEKTAEEPEEETTPTPTEEPSAGKTYVDNFAVPSEDAAAYAAQIQQVVKDKDLDTFTDMVAFPIYVMGSDGGQSITSATDFKALGADTLFTDAFVTEIVSADIDNLSASRAGFVVSTTGRPNVVFGVVNGELHIVSLNY